VNLGLEVWIARRYLRARRVEGFISVVAGFSLIGIALGVATLIIVMSVMNGFHTQLVDRIVGVNGHVVLQPPAGAETLTAVEGLERDLRALPRVLDVFAETEGQALATSAGSATGTLVRGIRPDDLRRRTLVADAITDGSLDVFAAEGGAVVGSRLARQLGIGAGDTLTLLHPDGDVTVVGTIPRVRTFTVAALFEIGMYEYDSGLVYLLLDDALAFFGTGEEATKIQVVLDDPDAAGQVSAELADTFAGRARTSAWPSLNRQFFNALKVERNVMFLILTLIILVAAFNVISSMIMLVRDKEKGIAIMRTMGASRAAVLRIFVFTGGSVGVIGTLLGFVLGLAFATNVEAMRRFLESIAGVDLFAAEIYFLSQLPSEVQPLQVTGVLAFALALALLATIYPAWRASRIDPAEVLRYG
jgi:lipoprotein-releasing system permease protein